MHFGRIELHMVNCMVGDGRNYTVAVLSKELLLLNKFIHTKLHMYNHANNCTVLFRNIT